MMIKNRGTQWNRRLPREATRINLRRLQFSCYG